MKAALAAQFFLEKYDNEVYYQKKIELNSTAVFFRKLFLFFLFFSHSETSHISHRGSVNANRPLLTNDAQW